MSPLIYTEELTLSFYASWFFALHIYQQSFSYFRMGHGSALAWISAVIVMALTIANVRLSDRWVYYGGAAQHGDDSATDRSDSASSWGQLAEGLRTTLLHILSIALATLFFFPYFYTLASSLKGPWEVYNWPPTLFPSELRWSNYVQTVSMVPFGRWVYNTIVITSLATLGTVLTSSLVAYSFARFIYRFRDLLFLITLGTMMMPAQVTLIPRFIMFFKFGEWTGLQFLNTWRPLWIPAWFGGGAFLIFLMRQFIQTIPRDFDEAALIDEASYLRIFWRIVMPLCKPVIATLAIISGIGQWNSFIEPMIYLNASSKFPISVGLHYFRETAGGMTEEPKEHPLMCGSVLMTLPPIILFFLFQEYFAGCRHERYKGVAAETW